MNPPSPAQTLPLLRSGHTVPLLSTSACTGGGDQGAPIGAAPWHPLGTPWEREGLGVPAGRGWRAVQEPAAALGTELCLFSLLPDSSKAEADHM